MFFIIYSNNLLLYHLAKIIFIITIYQLHWVRFLIKIKVDFMQLMIYPDLVNDLYQSIVYLMIFNN